MQQPYCTEESAPATVESASTVGPSLGLQKIPQRACRLAKQIGTAEALELAGRRQVRLQREEAVVAVGAQARPAARASGHALARRDDRAIGARILDMDIAQPGLQRLVGIGIGRLAALDEVGRVEDGPQMRIVDVLQQIDAAGDGVAVDVFLVLVQQGDIRRRAPAPSSRAAGPAPRRA